jgi:hypothetical protein
MVRFGRQANSGVTSGNTLAPAGAPRRGHLGPGSRFGLCLFGRVIEFLVASRLPLCSTVLGDGSTPVR